MRKYSPVLKVLFTDILYSKIYRINTFIINIFYLLISFFVLSCNFLTFLSTKL